jgi:thymidylate kinase
MACHPGLAPDQRGRLVRDVTPVPTHRRRGVFLALEGPDGVGKTTLAGLLAPTPYAAAVAGLPAGPGTAGDGGTPLVFVSRRQVSCTSAYAAKVMDRIATVLWHSGDSPDLPDAVWVHTQAAWFTAHSATVLEPLLAAGYDVLVDGWVYRFFGQLVEQGYAQADLDVIFARVRTPDAVLLLTADLAAIYRRRRSGFRPAELGMHAGYSGLGRDTFVDYQRRGLRRLLAYAARPNWLTVELGADGTAEENAAVIAPALAGLRAAVPQEPASSRNVACVAVKG